MHSTDSRASFRLLRPFAFALTFCGLAIGSALVSPAFAAEAATPAAASATGTIEGRVLNRRSGTVAENARVSIEGTMLVTFTDADGNFRLGNVPAGPVKLRVFFTGLAPQVVEIPLTAGETVQREIVLASFERDATAPAPDGTIKMEEFVVDVAREMDAAAIAINEQRFAPNVKNVVSTDEYGAVAEGNVADFLKFLPGITIDWSGGDSRTVSIDGAPPENTPITISGLNLPVPGNNNTSRAVEVGFFNLNNIARIEVSHSPTPDSPGSALAGSVNMVPRSSFERTRPVFNGSVYAMMRDDLITWNRIPAQYRDPTHVVHPGFDLSWVVPVNKRLGFSVSAGKSTQWSHQIGGTNVWRGNSAATNGNAFPHTTPDQPYLSAYTIRNSPKETGRESLGLNVDFKPGRYDRVSLSFQYSAFDGWTAARNLVFNPNRIVPGEFSSRFTHGVAGAGSLALTAGNGRVRENRTYLPTFNWRHDGPVWRMESGVGRGYGTNVFRDIDKGQLLTVAARRTNVTINFDDVGFLRPGGITVIDNVTGRPIDPYRIENYALNTISSNPRRASDVNFTAFGNVRRDFVWRVPVTLKAGLDFRQSSREIRAQTFTYTYGGPDGRGNTTVGSAAPFLDPVGSQRLGPYGFPAIQFADYKSTLDYFKANPTHFTLDENANYRAGVNNSKHAMEGVSAAYLRGDVALLNRRLMLVGGLRVEQTNIDAEGPLTDPSRNVRRDASGRPILDAAGRPVPITTNAFETSRLTLLERGTHVEKEYLRFFPSLNASYNIRENLIARAAISTSIGPPDFNQYAGGITLPNTDNPPGPGNRISVNNAGIKPWTATSGKVRLEYYFQGVGQISVGAFRREYENFFGNTVFVASPEFLALYGLDPAEYGPYEVSTQYNVSGTVRTEGIDVSYKQALTFLPRWARGVQVFGNWAVRSTKTPDLGSRGFNDIPRSGSFGVSLTRPRFNVRLNCNYRAKQNDGMVTGAGIEPGTFNYIAARRIVDVLGEYTFWRRFAVFANLRNIGDVPNRTLTIGPSTPGHARMRLEERYGSLWTLGLKGTF
ncbi:MAG: carboxypeptidase regulatory-like domain-containing protein [Opitutaceae bacterium]|nr:carboxypeptidase regulatory-like domain-containing protein [Opitutaceae bacterium]